jgi:hypothetical protein
MEDIANPKDFWDFMRKCGGRMRALRVQARELTIAFARRHSVFVPAVYRPQGSRPFAFYQGAELVQLPGPSGASECAVCALTRAFRLRPSLPSWLRAGSYVFRNVRMVGPPRLRQIRSK